MSKLLLVEDDKYLNKLLSDRLSLEGFKVISVLDGESAWNEVLQSQEKGEPFDILLVDMLLPRMMGAELFTKIRERPEFRDLSIHAMSGIYKEPQDIKDITALHQLQSYWTKPFKIEELISKLTGRKATSLPTDENHGELKDTPVEKIFMQAYDRVFTGKLLFRQESSERRVFFSNGFPVAAESTVLSESFGASLVQMGRITAEQREEASQRMVAEQTQFGKMLTKMGLLTQEDLFECLRKHTHRILLNCFTWKEGTFTFEPLQNLPDHIILLEFNPFLVILKAQTALYPTELLNAVYETKKDRHCHRSQRFYQILPLCNMDQDSLRFFRDIPPNKSLQEILQDLPQTKHESFLRVLYAMESIGVLEWKTQKAPPIRLLESVDFTDQFQKQMEASPEITRTLQSKYIEMLGKNHFELFELPYEATEDDINSAYRELRFQLHPDRFGDSLGGEAKRILDDMLARIDKAYQLLLSPQLKDEYLAQIKKAKSDSLLESKRFLEAQGFFREGLALLIRHDYSKALDKFTKAAESWSKGSEYIIYQAYTGFRLHHSQAASIEAQRLLQKLKDLAHQNQTSEVGFLLLGHSYLTLEKKDLAKEAYLRALKINNACDEASHALAMLGEAEFKKDRVHRAVKSSANQIKKVLLLMILLVAAATGWIVQQGMFETKEGVRIDPSKFSSILPLMEIRSKYDEAKIIVQEGATKGMPTAVLRSKCFQLAKELKDHGISRLQLYENQRIRALCAGENFKEF